MIKRIALLLSVMFAVGFFSTTVLAQEEEDAGTQTQSGDTTTDTQPTDGKKGKGGSEPECD